MGKIVELCGRDVFADLVIDRLHRALAEKSKGVAPARAGFSRCHGDTGSIEWMPYHVPGDCMTLKTVSYTPFRTTKRQYLPVISATLTRFDDETGRLTAMCDARLLTAIRTGAASAVASRLLARPESRVLGLVGAGAQAVTQAHALSRVFPLEQILVHDIEASHAASFADRVRFLDLQVRPAGLAELVATADIICTATTVGVGEGPVLSADGLQPHAHINAVGADLVGKTELPLPLLRAALVVPDHLDQARHEGECQQLSEPEIGPRLSAVCSHPERWAPYRHRTTVFDSTGHALEDHVALDVLLQLAAETGVGERMLMEHLPDDALDPYTFAH
ncbi:ornithine cyclodeaminase family protein [Streptomyces cellostaticus]|uniref:ornithine cyclodeaminase family protein n=1 Tax=Streptomyces cellostaticus TaxID=67285 RepID=UPI001FCA0511|nr:ornithine cyclodeaminase family protein [Streptomyces cellostaticus]